MPKAPKAKVGQDKKAVHPQSRKAMQIARKAHHFDKIDKRLRESHLKLESQGEKILWFKNSLDSEQKSCNKEDILHLIEKYLHRFDEELNQIEIVNNIKGRSKRQHASREDNIKHQIEKDEREFDTCGLEIPDLLNKENFKYILEWKGELRYLANIKLRRFTRKELQNSQNNSKSTNPSEAAPQDTVSKSEDDTNSSSVLSLNANKTEDTEMDLS